MAILPRSFYIETALRIDREASGLRFRRRAECNLSQSSHSLAKDTVLKMDVRDCARAGLNIRFMNKR